MTDDKRAQVRQKLMLYTKDMPLERARKMLCAMGMNQRPDDAGEILLRRAAEVLRVYRALDRGEDP